MSVQYWLILIVVGFYTLCMGIQDGANEVATPVVSSSIGKIESMLIACAVNIIAPIITFRTNNIQVALTIKESIVNSSTYSHYSSTEGFIFVFAAICSSTIWLIFASLVKLPSSASHALMGSLIGAALPLFGASVLNGQQIFFKVILVTLLTPIITLFAGYLIMIILRFVASRLRRRAIYIINFLQRVNVGIISMAISINDIMKSLGIVMLLIIAIPAKISYNLVGYEFLIIMSLIFNVGLIFGGNKLISTIGNKIYSINAFDSFVSQVSSQFIIFGASFLGIPVSIGQVTSSSIMGIGMTSNINSVRWSVSRKIVINWLLTIPCTLIFSALFALVLKGGMLK